MGIMGQIIYLAVVADRWPRKVTLWSGSIVLAICTVLSAEFSSQDNTDQAGARAAIGFIFIYSMCYAKFFNAIIWVVPRELSPFFLRSKGLTLTVGSNSVVAIVFVADHPDRVVECLMEV